MDLLTEIVRERLPEPAASRQVLQTLDRKDATSTEVAEAAQCDPLLASRLLRAVNSSYYGLRTEVTSLGRAITLLGFNAVRQLVFSQGMRTSANRFGVAHEFTERIAIHSGMVGATLQILAQGRAVDPHEVGTLGVLHDMGRILLQDRMFLDLAKQYQKQIPPEIFQALLGMLAARNWGLPEKICMPILYSSFPGRCNTDSVPVEWRMHAGLVAAANLFCSVYGFPDGSKPRRLSAAWLGRMQLAETPAVWIPHKGIQELEQSREAFS
jgi:HD-like signal output (HDOD) protein